MKKITTQSIKQTLSAKKEISKTEASKVFKKLQPLFEDSFNNIVKGEGITTSKPESLNIPQLKNAWSIDLTADNERGSWKMFVLLDKVGERERPLKFKGEYTLAVEMILEGSTLRSSKLLDVWSPDNLMGFNVGVIQKKLDKLTRSMS